MKPKSFLDRQNIGGSLEHWNKEAGMVVIKKQFSQKCAKRIVVGTENKKYKNDDDYKYGICKYNYYLPKHSCPDKKRVPNKDDINRMKELSGKIEALESETHTGEFLAFYPGDNTIR